MQLSVSRPLGGACALANAVSVAFQAFAKARGR
jgi:hypothetical protein